MPSGLRYFCTSLLTDMKEAYTTTAGITLQDDGIVRILVKEGASIQLADVENHFRVIERLSEGKKVLVLIDARVHYSMSAEARDYSAIYAPTSRLATAFITKSAAGKHIANLYMNFNRPSIPTRVFTDEAEAIAWLKTHLHS
jgi:hypothetical protein